MTVTDKALCDRIERILSEENDTLTKDTLSYLSEALVESYDLTSERDVRKFLWLNFFTHRSAERVARRIVSITTND